MPDYSDSVRDGIVRALAAKTQPMEITFRAETVFQLVAILQLALRHPDLPPSGRDVATRFINIARAYFKGNFEIQSVIEYNFENTPMIFVSGVTRDDKRVKCSHCGQWVQAETTVCKHCGRGAVE
jgi:hypothetical protein